MRIDVEHVDADEVFFTMRVRALPVGSMRMERVPPSLLTPPCTHAVRRLQSRARRAHDVWRVKMVYIDGPYKSHGHGAAFYAAVVRYFATRGGMLVRDGCTRGGWTSEAADRVWRSRQFNAEVVVDASVAWGGT